MKKPPKLFVCQSCGANFSRWAGKCEECGQWNTILEETSTGEKFKKQTHSGNTTKRYNSPVPISKVEEESFNRIKTGLTELDLVLGGGIVPGSLTLVGGEPGVGKSTLILEIARTLSSKLSVLYVSGEESSSQIGLRAKRMGIQSEKIFLSSESYAENISEMIEQERPGIVFIDSIQTVSKQSLQNQAGSVTQLRECTQVFLETAKRSNIPIFLIGHITKEGSIAGPKVLEHLVDTVLYFEGDKMNYYRLLRATKNRFGAIGDLAVFEMIASGLKEIKDKHNIFMSKENPERNGSIISVTMEGTRALSVEVQALVTRSSFSQARRMAEGLDNRRLILMAAVIEKFMGLKLMECDIFSNLAGGLTMDEPALDLAICASIISSYMEKPAKLKIAVVGEVGLSGEIRNIGQANTRIRELQGIGMETVVMPSGNIKEIQDANIKLIGIDHIRQLESIF